MGKCVASRYIPPAKITVCDGCFHKDVCGDKDYLTSNDCPARAGGCYCRECVKKDTEACPMAECEFVCPCDIAPTLFTANSDDGFCNYGKSKEDET